MKDANQPSPWQVWSYEVHRRLLQHQQQLERLEKQVSDLTEQLKGLEGKPAYAIERLEYHFDQLKVEKLEGTLNIGMTPPAVGANGETEGIDQFSVGGPLSFPTAGPSAAPQGDPLMPDIEMIVNGYLDGEGYAHLHELENEFGLPLDPYHKQMIIEDIRRQLPDRIRFYVRQTKPSGEPMDREQAGSAARIAADKTIRDAKSALAAYMSKLKSGSSSATGGPLK